MQKEQKNLFTLIPKYSYIPLIFSFTFNMAVYCFSRMIAGGWHHYNVESHLDGLVPFWPPSVAIYLGCYLFWIVNYVLLACQEKEEVCRFFSADFLSRVVCLLFFLAFPTTNTRPELDLSAFWDRILGIVYQVDAADNLFPSIHCLVSWFCFAGLREKSYIPAWYKVCSCILAVLVCISTVTTKQHVLLDVAGGILLAEASLWLGKKPAVWGTYEKILDKACQVTGLGRKGN